MSDSAIEDLKLKLSAMSRAFENDLKKIRETRIPDCLTLQQQGANLKKLRETNENLKSTLAKFGPDYDYGFFERGLELPEGSGIEAIFKALDGAVKQESDNFATRVMGGGK